MRNKNCLKAQSEEESYKVRFLSIVIISQLEAIVAVKRSRGEKITE